MIQKRTLSSRLATTGFVVACAIAGAVAEPLGTFKFDGNSLAPSDTSPTASISSPLAENLLAGATFTGDSRNLGPAVTNARDINSDSIAATEDPVAGTYVEWTVTVEPGETVEIDSVRWFGKARNFATGAGNEYNSGQATLYWDQDAYASPVSPTATYLTDEQLGNGSWVGPWQQNLSTFAPITLDGTDVDTTNDSVTFRIVLSDALDVSTAELRLDLIQVNPSLDLASGTFEVKGSDNTGFVDLLDFTQSGGSARFEIAPSGNDTLNLSGDYTYTGGQLDLRLGTAPALASPYTLIDYAGTLSGSPTVNVEPAPADAGLSANVSLGSGSDDAITIEFTETTAPSTLTWTGSVNNVWDLNATANWSDGAAATYLLFDSVTFDDTAAGSGTVTIDLVDDVLPGSVDFNNSARDFILSGSNSIGGDGLLTKDGPGSLTITTDNSYTGGTEILDGIVQVGDGGTSGSLGSGDILNDGSLVIERDGVLSLPGVISGLGGITIDGPGTTIVANDNTFLGDVEVNSGTLQVGDGGASGSLGDALTVFNEGALVFNRGGTLEPFADITGTGSVEVAGPGTIIFSTITDYTGGTTISGGTLQLGNGSVDGLVTGPIVTDGTLAVQASGATYDLGNDVSGAGGVALIGPVDYSLTGTNSYTGGTALSDGASLLLAPGSSLPAASAFQFVGVGNVLDTDGNALTFASLDAATGGIGTNTITGGGSVTVTGGDLEVGPNNESAGGDQVALDLSGIDDFDYNNPGGVVRVGSIGSGQNNRQGSLTLAPQSNLNAASIRIQSEISGGAGQSSGTLNLGADTTLEADSFLVGTGGRENALVQFDQSLGSGNLTLRASDGSGRMDIQIGDRFSSVYSTHDVGVDLVSGGAVSSTLDAQVGSLRIGEFNFGNGVTQNAFFRAGAGTLDATTVEVGFIEVVAQTGGILNSSLELNGTNATIGSLIIAENLSTAGTPAVNGSVLLNGGSLTTSSIATGSDGVGTESAVFQWNSGTIQDNGSDLLIDGVRFELPSGGTKALSAGSGLSTSLGSATVLDFGFDPNTNAAGTLTVSGNLDLGADTELVLSNEVGGALAGGSVLTLIDYSGGSLTGTFVDSAGDPINDGDVITLAANQFQINYNDANQVTLSSASATSSQFVYDFGDIIGGSNNLSTDGWVGDDLANWLVASFNGDLYARNNNGGNDRVTRPNDATFTYAVPSSSDTVSLTVIARINNNSWSGGLVTGTTTTLGIGYDGGTNQVYLLDGATRIDQTGTFTTGDALLELRVTIDLGAGTADLILDPDGAGTVLLAGAPVSLTGSDLSNADGLFVQTNSQFNGPARFTINAQEFTFGGGGTSPIESWATGFGLDPLTTGAPTADPDMDGLSNLVEFAVNSDPTSPTAPGKVVSSTQQVGGDNILTLTLPVRGSATPFSGATEQVSDAVDGIIYRIQGSDDLSDFTSMVISEVTPALDSGLPALDSGWEYRTFRTPGTIDSDPQDFLRALIEETP